jgi:hypothetical protein
MNKMIIITCIVISVFLVNAGLSINAQVEDLSRQKDSLLVQNNHMGAEILERQQLIQKLPIEISKAFSLVINEIRYLEENSGTTMNLTIEKSVDDDDIANHYIGSQYRGIKKLPVTIEVDKFSDETDMGAVLNDVYQLELETDFKATEINKEGNTLIVKGDVYGF